MLEQRKKTPEFGSKRLIKEFERPLSHNVANRIFRKHDLLIKIRKKHHKRNDLRAIKGAYKAFTRISIEGSLLLCGR